MKVFIAWILWLLFVFFSLWWVGQAPDKPKEEPRKVRTLAQMGPDIRHCMQPIDFDCITDDPM